MAWVAEDTFDSYSDGDLNGSNGGTGFSAAWSGSTAFDVQGSVTYGSSTKAIIGTNANGSITRTLTSTVTAGEMFFAMRVDVIGSNQDMQLDLVNSGGAATAARISMRTAGSTKNLQVLGAATTTLLTPFVLSTWYLFDVKFNGDNTLDIRYSTDGATWSAWTTNLGYGTAAAIESVRFNCSGSITPYWDYISPTNPIASASSSFRSRMLTGIGQ